MKRTLLLLSLNLILTSSYALGPNEISFNGEKFYKDNEKHQDSAIIVEYAPANKNSSSSIVLTHVLNKNDPNKIAQGLKTKKSIEVVDIENLKEDHSDMLVSFIKFDVSNLKVQNNLCRIIRSADKGGSFVFQYVDTKRMKSQSEGATLPDFTLLSENMKQAPVDQYLHASASFTPPSYAARAEKVHHHVPWYRRANARAGRGAYEHGYNRRTSYRDH